MSIATRTDTSPQGTPAAYPILSADSHVTEPPSLFDDYLDPSFRDRAPRLVEIGAERGQFFAVDGMKAPYPLGPSSAAGKRPEEVKIKGVRFSDLHVSGWNSSMRLADQDKDGVAAEVLYPSLGMFLCNHPDLGFKKAVFDAYNRWLADYCSVAPHRLIGLGQTAVRTPDEAVRDLESIKALGLRGVTMPGAPGVSDYDDPIYDQLWQASIDLELPLSFHILTTRSEKPRGPKLAGFLSIVRGVQDIMGMLVLSGAFDRNPMLRIVCAEADAGWVPHYMYRMDHAYNRHRFWLAAGHTLSRMPSEYFSENIYVTFQDDWVALKIVNELNWHRLCWANDFPHSDSTWPWSQELLDAQASGLTVEQRRAITCDNVAALYGIDLASLPHGSRPAAHPKHT
jgi:predicted TIM-barrel fold metal-dependent hydrolase